MKLIPFCFVLVLCASSFAQDMYQTDWSGGPGVTGPVYYFDDTFCSSQLIDFTVPGCLTLVPDWSTDDYPDSGSLLSTMVYIPMGTDWEIDWGNIEWISVEPPGTSVYFRLRTGMTPDSMGEWTDPITESGTYLGDMLPTDVFILQYLVCMLSADSSITPELDEVVIWGWYPGGIAGQSLTGNAGPLEVASNPASMLAVTVHVTEPGEYDLQVFDIAGRAVSTVLHEYCGQGDYQRTLDDLQEGSYILRLYGPEGISTRKVIILRES